MSDAISESPDETESSSISLRRVDKSTEFERGGDAESGYGDRSEGG